MLKVRNKLILFSTILLLTLLPWLIQVIATPHGAIPTGFCSGGEDYHTFMTKMKWGQEGHWSYENRFTGEETEPVPFYHFYMFLGHLAGWLGISLPWMYHLIHGVLGAVAAVYMLIFFKKYVPINPVLTFILALLTSGGYLMISDNLFGTSFNEDGTDQFLQGRVWLAYLTFPHYFLDLLGILLLLESYLARRPWMALPGGFLISLAHPFLLGLFCPVILFTAIHRRDFKEAITSCAAASLAALPIMIPMFLAMLEVEWLKIWREQTYRETPNFIKFFIICYGVVGIAGWLELIKWLRKKNETMTLWVVWLLLAVILSYLAPLPNKREFAFFIAIPLGVLATPLIDRFIQWFKQTNGGLTGKFGVILIVLTCTWHAAVLYSYFLVSFKPTDTFTGFYITEEYQRVFEMIDSTGSDQVILSANWLGNLIPAYTGSRPYVGHSCETIAYKQKRKSALEFLRGEMSENKMNRLLNANNINWIIYDKHSAKGNDIVTGKLWEPVFKGDEVIVWKVD